MGSQEYEPYIIFASDKFFSELRKKHGLGVLSRKPFLKILADYGIQFEELDRDTAKEVLDSVSVKAGVRTADMIKGIALALFTPTTVFYALAKKVNFIGGAKSGNDFIILHLTAEIPRAFRTTLFYHMFITIPLSKVGFEGTVNLYKKIRGEVGLEPLTKEDWENLRTIREKNAEVLKINGLLENLWNTVLAA